MKVPLRVIAVLALLAAVVAMAAPTQAASGNLLCTVDPGTGPIGTTFTIACTGFSANTILNIYAVEPDGRASGANIYGFFPESVKTDKTGSAAFEFVTEFPGLYSVPPGNYTFVVHELGVGGVVAEVHIPITVQPAQHPLIGALLTSKFVSSDNAHTVWFEIAGLGFNTGEAVNIWITQPPAAQCSGLGIDQLSLDSMAGGGSSLWDAPTTVWADADGAIDFTVGFHTSACRGEHLISARALKSEIGGQVPVLVEGFSTRAANAFLSVNPAQVPAYNSFHIVSGTDFPANTGLTCWYTRPDGRVLEFIAFGVKTDASGSFAVGSSLDDLPPYTATDPGTWRITCATPNRSALGQATFQVFALMSDP